MEKNKDNDGDSYHLPLQVPDQLAKEAARDKNIDECYNGLPKSELMCELKEQGVKLAK
jgi:hypothetical protein